MAANETTGKTTVRKLRLRLFYRIVYFLVHGHPGVGVEAVEPNYGTSQRSGMISF